MIQCKNGFLFGAYLNEYFEKKHKNITVIDKFSILFSYFGKEPVFYPVNNDKFQLTEYGI